MSQEIAVVSLEPMRLAQILDRSLKLLPGIFRKALPWYVLLAALAMAQNLAQRQEAIIVMVAFTILQMPVAFFVFMVTTSLSADHWVGNTANGVREAMRRVSFGLAMRILGVTIVAFVATMLWSILLLIPGIIYSVNRILAWYVLIVEDTSVSESLKKSKFLMTQDKWYRSSSPWARVTGISLILLFVRGIPSIVVVGAAAWVSTQNIDLVVVGVIMFVGNLVLHFFSIFSQLAFIGFYYDLRARYEGADIVAGLERLQPQGGVAL